MSDTLTDVDIDELIKEVNSRSLILYNDDVNTFDHVINCLMIYCDHTLPQSEQCALTVHAKGKCSIKSGTFDELAPLHKILSDKQLTVDIQ